jgi:uncharacterized protein YqeY
MTEQSILSRLQTDMTAAMKSRDADTLSTLRMLKASLMEAKTQKPKDVALSSDEELEIVQRYVKKRREVIEEMRKLGREDVVGREQQEIDVASRYLPPPVSEDELRALVRAAIERTGATGPRDMGKVIGAVMGQIKGRAEGGTVSRLVKEALAAG